MDVITVMTMSFGSFSSHESQRRREDRSIVLKQEFACCWSFFQIYACQEKILYAQKNKKWIKVGESEKNGLCLSFFKSMLARKGFCMQQNDIAVLRRCQRFFLLGLLFYDDASDFFLRDCNFTTVPGQLFLFFYKTHKFPYW